MTVEGGTSDLITCQACGAEAPARRHCVMCGARQVEPGLRPRYAASPDQAPVALRVISTLLPQLPRADMDAFSLALGVGTALVLVLAAAGYYPIALVAGALVVPLLMTVYLVAVDVYEDEPLPVVIFTLAWGALAGALYAALLRALFPAAAGPFGADDLPTQLARGVLLPALAAGLMLAGPLILLPYRRFNDVLDGATFGALSGVSFLAAQVIVQSADLLGAGLRPGGDELAWIMRVLVHSVALPLVAAGAIGGTAGSLWLRFRSPARDRRALGPLGHPVVAVCLAVALLVAADLALLHLRDLPRLLAIVALAVVALTWLRIVVHRGLHEEAVEFALSEPAACQNCGRSTPPGSFCAECGIALRALPKRPPGETAPTLEGTTVVAGPRRDQPVRLGGRRSLLVFVVGLVVTAAVVGVVAVILASPAPVPPCNDPTVPCPLARSAPVSAVPAGRSTPDERAQQDAPVMRFGETWRDQDLGWQVDYETSVIFDGQAYPAWELDSASEAGALWLGRDWGLRAASGDMVTISMWLRVEVVPTGERTRADMLGHLLDYVRSGMDGVAERSDHPTSLLGPHIGYQPAESRYLVGDSGEEGAVVPWGIEVLAASDGRLTAGMIVYLSYPDSTFGFHVGTQRAIRYLGDAFDDLVKRFYWSGADP